MNVVLYLAATQFSFQENYKHAIVDGTKILLEEMLKKDIKKLVVYSTDAVYGALNNCINEKITPKPNMLYGGSKYEVEKMIIMIEEVL